MAQTTVTAAGVTHGTAGRRYGRRFRHLLIERIARERGIPAAAVAIVEVATFPQNRWGHVGTVEVVYAPGQPWRALYGFDALAHVSCYAD